MIDKQEIGVIQCLLGVFYMQLLLIILSITIIVMFDTKAAALAGQLTLASSAKCIFINDTAELQTVIKCSL